MPFEELETQSCHNGPPKATLSYLLGIHKDNKVPKPDAKPKLVVCVPTTICGMSKSETFRLLVGTGADAGKLLIRGELAGAKSAGIKPSQLKHYFRWHFGFVPKLGEDRFGPDKYDVRKISDEEFEISVPESWFVDKIPAIPLKKRA